MRTETSNELSQGRADEPRPSRRRATDEPQPSHQQAQGSETDIMYKLTLTPVDGLTICDI